MNNSSKNFGRRGFVGQSFVFYGIDKPFLNIKIDRYEN
jgi:hypothetical protein